MGALVGEVRRGVVACRGGRACLRARQHFQDEALDEEPEDAVIDRMRAALHAAVP